MTAKAIWVDTCFLGHKIYIDVSVESVVPLIAALLKKILIHGEMVFPNQEQNYSILRRKMLATATEP